MQHLASRGELYLYSNTQHSTSSKINKQQFLTNAHYHDLVSEHEHRKGGYVYYFLAKPVTPTSIPFIWNEDTRDFVYLQKGPRRWLYQPFSINDIKSFLRAELYKFLGFRISNLKNILDEIARYNCYKNITVTDRVPPLNTPLIIQPPPDERYYTESLELTQYPDVIVNADGTVANELNYTTGDNSEYYSKGEETLVDNWIDKRSVTDILMVQDPFGAPDIVFDEQPVLQLDYKAFDVIKERLHIIRFMNFINTKYGDLIANILLQPIRHVILEVTIAYNHLQLLHNVDDFILAITPSLYDIQVNIWLFKYLEILTEEMKYLNAV